MSESRAKCPQCKLLFSSSFEDVSVKTCPCCDYTGKASEFLCTEEEWLKKKKLKKAFLTSMKNKEGKSENKLKQIKKIFRGNVSEGK